MKNRKSNIVIATESNLSDLCNLPADAIIHAFKVVRQDFSPPAFPEIRPRLRYSVGKTVIERDFNGNPSDDCGAGLNVATKRWCKKICYGDACSRERGDKLITVSFRPKDIICIPYGSMGKFRVKRLTVIGVGPVRAQKR